MPQQIWVTILDHNKDFIYFLCSGLLAVDVNFTFPSFWCWSKAAMSSLAHWTLSGWGENSSCTAWICPGWITCLPSRKTEKEGDVCRWPRLWTKLNSRVVLAENKLYLFFFSSVRIVFVLKRNICFFMRKLLRKKKNLIVGRDCSREQEEGTTTKREMTHSKQWKYRRVNWC